MKKQTVVKWFDAKKGYGFLVHPDGGADIFVHYTSIESDARFRTLRTGEEVTFDMYDGPKGVHARSIISLDPLPEGEAFSPPSPEAAAETTHLSSLGLSEAAQPTYEGPAPS